jgi:hypothetical protein
MSIVMNFALVVDRMLLKLGCGKVGGRRANISCLLNEVAVNGEVDVMRLVSTFSSRSLATIRK